MWSGEFIFDGDRAGFRWPASRGWRPISTRNTRTRQDGVDMDNVVITTFDRAGAGLLPGGSGLMFRRHGPSGHAARDYILAVAGGGADRYVPSLGGGGGLIPE